MRAFRSALIAIAAMACALAIAPTAAAWPGGAAKPPLSGSPVHPDVVNGRTPEPGEVRALVYVSSGGFSCGGTLVDSIHVITAAHCATDSAGNPRSPSAVRVGWSTTTGRPAATYAVAKVSVNPTYSSTTYSNDLAVLTLAGSIPGATPMLVASSSRSTTALAAGATVRSAGYGRVSVNGPLSAVALVADLTVLPDNVCGSTTIPYRIGRVDFFGYGNEVDTTNAVCAIGVVPTTTLIIDTCQGDSGGPLFTGSGVNARLVGVVSVGDGCAGYDESGQPMPEKVPGVYARTSSALDWLARVGVDMSDTSLAPPVITTATARDLGIDVTVQPGSTTRLDTITVTAVNVADAANTANCTAAITGPSASCRIDSLIPGATYSLTAVAVSGELTSSPSTAKTVTMPGRPGAPVIRSGVYAGKGQVRLAVTPGADNGSPVTSTTVSCAARGPAKTTVPRAVGSVVKGSVTLVLTPGYRYTCRAVSTNAFGSTRSQPFSFGF